MQVETRVKLNPDGSATVTERVRFSKRLIDLAAENSQAESILKLLERKAVEERVKRMGKGAKLASHKVQKAAGDSRESISVIEFTNLNDLRYVSPFLSRHDYPKHTGLKFGFGPIMESRWHEDYQAGRMAVHIAPTSSGRAPRRPKNWKPPRGPSPLDLQVYRELHPMFRDMLKGCRIRVIFESYAPILVARGYYRFRGQRSGTRQYDLIDFSANDLDNHGAEFLGNEEIMLELLRMHVSGRNVVNATKGHGTNGSVPVYHPHGIPAIVFRPSRELFDRHFKGKTLKLSKRQGGPRKADFKRDGYYPHAGKKKEQAPKKPPSTGEDGSKKPTASKKPKPESKTKSGKTGK